jgi:hypothetical protein
MADEPSRWGQIGILTFVAAGAGAGMEAFLNPGNYKSDALESLLFMGGVSLFAKAVIASKSKEDNKRFGVIGPMSMVFGHYLGQIAVTYGPRAYECVEPYLR